jgi:hypothetical protein
VSALPEHILAVFSGMRIMAEDIRGAARDLAAQACSFTGDYRDLLLSVF